MTKWAEVFRGVTGNVMRNLRCCIGPSFTLSLWSHREETGIYDRRIICQDQAIKMDIKYQHFSNPSSHTKGVDSPRDDKPFGKGFLACAHALTFRSKRFQHLSNGRQIVADHATSVCSALYTRWSRYTFRHLYLLTLRHKLIFPRHHHRLLRFFQRLRIFRHLAFVQSMQ